jgi:hypothetical protein
LAALVESERRMTVGIIERTTGWSGRHSMMAIAWDDAGRRRTTSCLIWQPYHTKKLTMPPAGTTPPQQIRENHRIHNSRPKD